MPYLVVLADAALLLRVTGGASWKRSVEWMGFAQSA